MMKQLDFRVLVLSVSALLMGTGYAGTRDLQTMKSIAASVLLQQRGATDRRQVQSKETLLHIAAKSSDIECMKECPEERFYVYSFSDGTPGYVVVPTDDTQPEVLGYSFNDTFSVGDVPEAMAVYLEVISRPGATAPQCVGEETYGVDPLLEDIHYHQGSPYNNLCPLVDGTPGYVGCVAVAMAQIMAYYGYPDRMMGEDISYTTSTLGIPVTWNTTGTVFDWEKIGQGDDDALAQLSAACGASIQADYLEGATGAIATMAFQALYRNMGYDSKMTYYVASYFTTDEVNTVFMEELNERRPIMVSGVSGVDGTGHTFVCDGYSVNEGVPYFHMNWGWGGYANGYFLLQQTDGAPDKDVIEYASRLNYVVGIEPETGVAGGTVLTCGEVDIEDRTDYNCTVYWMDLLTNSSLEDFSGSIVAYAVDKAGNRYKLAEMQGVELLAATNSTRWSNIGFAGQYLSVVSKNLQDGNYSVEFVGVAADTGLESIIHTTNHLSFRVGDAEDATDDEASVVIRSVENVDAAATVYDLSGRKLDGLKKGINIVNGVKVLVK